MQIRQKTGVVRRLKAMMAGVAVAGALLLGAGAPPAQAQAQTVGVVDGVKINDNYAKLKTALENIDKRRQQLRDQLNGRVFLAEADTKRFDALVLNTKRNDGENKDLDKLVKSGSDRGNEYKTLIGKTPKSDADNARIKALEDEAQRTSAGLDDIAKRVEDSVVKQAVETEDQYRTQIVKVVEQVATEKKLVLVVGKQAIAWNSATIEITDEVLSRLNKG